MVTKQQSFAQALEDNLRRVYSSNEVEHLKEKWQARLSELGMKPVHECLKAGGFTLTYVVEGAIGNSAFSDHLIVGVVEKAPTEHSFTVDELMGELTPFGTAVLETLKELVPDSELICRIFTHGEEDEWNEYYVLLLERVTIGGEAKEVIAYLANDGTGHRNQ